MLLDHKSMGWEQVIGNLDYLAHWTYLLFLQETLMKIIIAFIMLCMIMMISTTEGFAGMYDDMKPKENEAAIHFSGVEVPLNRIVLIRKDARCCALKFIHCWTEMDEERLKEYAAYIDQGGDIAEGFKDASEKKYAIYEAYYQADCTGDFANKNVKVNQGKASWLPLRGPFRPFIYQPGDSYVKCGPIKLTWEYKTLVGFMPPDKGMGDFGFELAPTPWTDIKEVNIKDPQVKWYRYDEKRPRVFIPIDKLWEDTEKKETPAPGPDQGKTK